MMNIHDLLARFRGEFPAANLNARRVAAAVEAPGCQRRTVLEAGVVNIEKLAKLVSGSDSDRQSPFAIARGNQFESRVTDNGMAAILSLARQYLDLEIPEAREKDLSRSNVCTEFPDIPASRMNEHRALLTKQYIDQMLREPEYAINLLRHALTTFTFGGEVAYLEQDVLAFTVKGKIHVVEIKSFPKIDGRSDPAKASTTVMQSAVYVMSLQELVASIGYPKDSVDTNVMIVMPENLSFHPTASVFDTKLQVRRLRRQLDNVPQISSIIDKIPIDIVLPRLPDRNNESEIAEARETASTALSVLPSRFSEGCLQCPLFRFCRQEAEIQQNVARLGMLIAGECGSVTSINEALDLANGRRSPANPGERASAEHLSRGIAALELINERI